MTSKLSPNLTAVEDLTILLLKELAPDEIPLVREYLANPTSRAVSSGALGFGISGGIELLLPYLVSFLKGLVDASVTSLAKTIGKEIVEKITSKHSAVPTLDAQLLLNFANEFESYTAKQGLAPEVALKAKDCLIRLIAKDPALLKNILSQK